jgi:hypothetical protein
MSHYLQGAQFLEVVGRINRVVQAEHTDENVNLIRSYINELRSHANHAVGDKYFNPMSTSDPFTNLANIEKHKIWIQIYNIFKFVDSENA